MNTTIHIFTTVLLPIFLQVAFGFILSKKVHLEMKTLSHIQMYVLIPGLLFYNIYTSQAGGQMMLRIVVFTTVLFFVLMILSTLSSRLFNFKRSKEKAFVNSVILRNQGNFTIPLITLAFAGAHYNEAISYHIVVLFTTNLLLNTFGLYNASAGKYTAREAMISMAKLPMIYTILIALLLKYSQVQVWQPFLDTTKMMGQGLVAVALLTLGAQLGQAKTSFRDPSIYVSNLYRLVVSPLIAWLMVSLLGYEGILAQVLVIGAAAPSAVNSVLLAIQFDGDATYASESVFTSTIISALTVSITVSLALNYL